MTIKEMIDLEMEEITVEEMDFIEEIESNLGCGIDNGWGGCGKSVH